MKLLTSIFAALFTGISSLFYSPAVTQTEILTTISHPVQENVYAASGIRSEVKKPKGIARFPNGGATKVLSTEGVVWIIDLDKNEIRELQTFNFSDKCCSSYQMRLMNWEGEILYTRVSGIKDPKATPWVENYTITTNFESSWRKIQEILEPEENLFSKSGSTMTKVEIKNENEKWEECCQINETTGKLEFL